MVANLAGGNLHRFVPTPFNYLVLEQIEPNKDVRFDGAVVQTNGTVVGM